MKATIKNISATKTCINVLVNFGEFFGDENMTFQLDVTADQIRANVESRKMELQAIIDARDILQDLVGTEL